MANRLGTFWDDEYLVGKIFSRSNGFFFQGLFGRPSEEMMSFLLMVDLLCMLGCEPMIHCIDSEQLLRCLGNIHGLVGGFKYIRPANDLTF